MGKICDNNARTRSGALGLIIIGFRAINVTTISSLCLNLCNVYASRVAIFFRKCALYAKRSVKYSLVIASAKNAAFYSPKQSNSGLFLSLAIEESAFLVFTISIRQLLREPNA